MGFLNGRVTFHAVSGRRRSPPCRSARDAEPAWPARDRPARRRPSRPTASSSGWAGGDHVLDVTFDLGKNVINDALHLAIRIDTDKIPGYLLRAYTQIETDARAQLNPSGRPTKAQRQEAKEAARLRAEAEAADGRFRRLQALPGPLGRPGRHPLRRDRPAPRCSTASRRSSARRSTGRSSRSRPAAWPRPGRGPRRRTSVEDVDPLALRRRGGRALHGRLGRATPRACDYLGNEFLVWLWHTLQNDGDTIPLADGSEAAVMLAKTLTLDCPRGETGRDSLTDEGPTRLPGGLPRPPVGQAAAQGRA